MHVKLIALDLDGTLIGPKGVVDDRDLSAIAEAQDRGIEVTLITGRLYPGIRPVARRLGLAGPVASTDGSHIVSAADGASLMHDTLSAEVVQIIKGALAGRPIVVFPVLGHALVHDESGDCALGYVRGWSNDMRRTPNVYAHETMTGGVEPTALLAVAEAEYIFEAAATLGAALGRKVHIETHAVSHMPATPFAASPSGWWAMTMRSGACDKSTALRWIAEYHGVPLEDCVAVGDWLNDRSMLALAGRSFAMPRAPFDVQECASDVLEAGEGVAQAIRLCLGKLQ